MASRDRLTLDELISSLQAMRLSAPSQADRPVFLHSGFAGHVYVECLGEHRRVIVAPASHLLP